jgi:hypothetical protein
MEIDKIKVGEELVKPIELTKPQLQRLFRFAFEEEHRRNLARGKVEALKEEEALDMLFPGWKAWVDQLILDKQTAINTEIMAQMMSGVEEAMGPFEALATKFRNYDTGVEPAPEPIPILFKKKASKSEDAKMESPAVSKASSVQPGADKEEEKKEPEQVTTLKSLNMEDVMKKT